MSDNWVIDTSVLIKSFIKEQDSRRVRTLINQLRSSNPPTLHVPETCLPECGNVLWKQVRFHGLPSQRAKVAMKRLVNLPLTIYPANELLPRTLEIALDHTLAVYDTLYLALAEKVKHPFITVDARQMAIAQTLGLVLKPITDFAEYTP